MLDMMTPEQFDERLACELLSMGEVEETTGGIAADDPDLLTKAFGVPRGFTG